MRSLGHSLLGCDFLPDSLLLLDETTAVSMDGGDDGKNDKMFVGRLVAGLVEFLVLADNSTEHVVTWVVVAETTAST